MNKYCNLNDFIFKLLQFLICIKNYTKAIQKVGLHGKHKHKTTLFYTFINVRHTLKFFNYPIKFSSKNHLKVFLNSPFSFTVTLVKSSHANAY